MFEIADAPQEPKTAEELNGWLNKNFAVFVGPPRAYFELPTPPIHGSIHGFLRRVYKTIMFVGEEGECVTAAREVLTVCSTLEEFQDASVAVVVRRPFEYLPPHYQNTAFDSGGPPKWELRPGTLSARITFMEEARNALLAPHVKPELWPGPLVGA